VAGVKVTPDGSDPDSARVGIGKPAAVTVKLPATPLENVTWLVEVIAGAASAVRMNIWVAAGATPLPAVMVIGKVPLCVGVPESSPPDVNVTPAGRAPVSLKVGAGEPVAVTVKVPAVPSVKVVLFTEVIRGAVAEATT
jgi:hypothetical protein